MKKRVQKMMNTLKWRIQMKKKKVIMKLTTNFSLQKQGSNLKVKSNKLEAKIPKEDNRVITLMILIITIEIFIIMKINKVIHLYNVKLQVATLKTGFRQTQIRISLSLIREAMVSSRHSNLILEQVTHLWGDKGYLREVVDQRIFQI